MDIDTKEKVRKIIYRSLRGMLLTKEEYEYLFKIQEKHPDDYELLHSECKIQSIKEVNPFL
jgi:uncharacterized HAD superfamily protein